MPPLTVQLAIVHSETADDSALDRMTLGAYAPQILWLDTDEPFSDGLIYEARRFGCGAVHGTAAQAVLVPPLRYDEVVFGLTGAGWLFIEQAYAQLNTAKEV
ncbi:hypothetical protein [Streptomyces melanogenes]|uniref:hypothetical protein n=1 Tax=Streptomyces melanogenes TaxID=67326 RepID=UPI00167D4EAD|nr:hypothetical protein [Streptomyces melanogenes]GGP56590.1 hypothetical protein GCM10010278_37140 [Streptomyces melanogenes]